MTQKKNKVSKTGEADKNWMSSDRIFTSNSKLPDQDLHVCYACKFALCEVLISYFYRKLSHYLKLGISSVKSRKLNSASTFQRAR